jgi:SAM-dependent methyltransferase
MTDKITLNQLYRRSKTFEEVPIVKSMFDELTLFSEKYILDLKPPGMYSNNTKYGRIYDYSVLSSCTDVNFKDKVICDLGARNGFWGIYLSQIAKRVDISDYFDGWETGCENGLYNFENEEKFVKTICSRIGTSDKVNVHHQDITNITYDDNSYDIVLCTSVIEHMYTQVENDGKYIGDIQGMKHMERICKPGGYVLLSTDMSPLKNTELPSTSIERWYSGTYWYNEKDLFDRIINSTSLELVGEYDFSFENPHNDDMNDHQTGFTVSPVILILRKPE